MDQLHGAEHNVIPDRIEAGTYMIAAAMTGGDLELQPVRPDHLRSLIDKMLQAGISVEEKGDRIRVKAAATIKPVDAETVVFPGFPTDLQAQWMALMSMAKGTSQVSERVFENRFMHVAELQRMGAQIQVKGHYGHGGRGRQFIRSRCDGLRSARRGGSGPRWTGRGGKNHDPPGLSSGPGL